MSDIPAVYLAGKISKNDWRHEVVSSLRGALESYERPADLDPPRGHLVFKAAEYVGPFVMSDDHGCFHGPNTHGQGAWDACAGAYSHVTTRTEVAQRARVGIAEADHIFVWLDDLTAYGTLVEVGFAAGLGKRVWIYTAPGKDHADLWFASHLATNGVVSYASDPVAAVIDFVRKIDSGNRLDEAACAAALEGFTRQ